MGSYSHGYGDARKRLFGLRRSATRSMLPLGLRSKPEYEVRSGAGQDESGSGGRVFPRRFGGRERASLYELGLRFQNRTRWLVDRSSDRLQTVMPNWRIGKRA